MEIWLKQGKTKFRLAVVPPEYELASESGNTQVVIHSLGEINLLGKRKLKTVSFSSFFPKEYNSSYCSYKKFPTPKESVKKIEKMKNKGILHLTMTNTPVNMDCTIESFTWGENDGSKDINFTLEFKEYRKPVIKGRKNKEKVTKKIALPITQRPVKEIEDAIYTVKKGDDLCKIAKVVTGSSANWRAVYLQNKELIGDNPEVLFPGQRLVVKV